jgi:phasin
MNTTTPNFEIPPEMRAFAEKSVAQAKEAFDGFVKAAQHASTTAATTAESASSNAKSVVQLAMTNVQRNIDTSFDFAQKLVRAKDPQEVMALHADYVKQQISTLSDQARELSRKSTGAGTDPGKPS